MGKNEHAMTPESLFRKNSLKRWFCLGEFFGPPYVVTLPDGSACMGCQVMVAMDVESQYILGQWVAPRSPGPISADEVSRFLNTVFSKHGKPKDGVLISCSVWESVDALYFDPVTRERVEDVFRAGIGWPAMAAAERSRIESCVRNLGISIAWSEKDIPDSVIPRSDTTLN